MGAYSRGVRLLNLLDYQGTLIREGRLKGAGCLFESLRYAVFDFYCENSIKNEEFTETQSLLSVYNTSRK